jgi:hypothetical protein
MDRKVPVPRCPIRLGEACTLCVPGATGPADCGLVWIIMSDPETREELRKRREEYRLAHPAA